MLVSLAREGDRDAFAQLVRRNQSGLRGVLRRACGDSVLADDLAQQTFLTAFQKISNLKTETAFPAWLKKIGINMWLQHCRKNDLLEDTTDSGELTVEPPGPGLSLDLTAALTELSPMERLCIVLNYQEGMSHSEIASTIETPLGTVKSHIQRGTKKLNLLLEAYLNHE